MSEDIRVAGQAEQSAQEMPDCLLKFINKHEGNDPIALKIRTDECPFEEIVYLPARIVRSLIVKHTAHPSTQFIISMKIKDASKKIGYREELMLFTKEQFFAEKVDIERLIEHNKVYVNQQMVWIKSFSRFGDKVAELHELQEFNRVLDVV